MNFLSNDKITLKNLKISEKTVIDEKIIIDEKSEENIVKTKLMVKKTIEPNNYIEYHDANFKNNLGKYTFGLNNVIPWENGGFVFSGGLLSDIVKNNFNAELMDIDLFLYGSTESKINTLNKLLDNLDLNQYNYIFGCNGSVIYIMVQGISRLIQLIMTKKTKPEEIIDGFDFTHLQIYYDGNKIFGTEKAIEQIKTNMTEFTETHEVQQRLIKYFEKGICNLEKIIYSTDKFILHKKTLKKLMNERALKKLYKTTHNLTIYTDLTPINFNNFDINKIDLKKYIGVHSIYYSKPNNTDLMKINMDGKFLDYFNLNNNLKNTFNYELQEDSDYDFSVRHEMIYDSDKYSGFYLPCKFIRQEDFSYVSNDNEIKNGKKIYFKIQNKILSEKIISIVNYKNFKLDIIDNNFDSILQTKLENESINHFSVISPFENSLDYPNVNLNSVSNEFAHTDGLIIKSNIYNIEWFENVNMCNILNKLNKEQDLYCVFRYFIHVDLNHEKKAIDLNDEKKTINLIDINLQSFYIHIKK